MGRFYVALFVLLLVVFSAFSYSYNASPRMPGENTLTINPSVYVNKDGLYGQKLFLGYGISDRADIWMDINMIPGLQLTNGSIMFRFDFTRKNTILALRANGTCVVPQFHWMWENDRIALQTNLACHFNYVSLSNPAIYSILSPTIKPFERLSNKKIMLIQEKTMEQETTSENVNVLSRDNNKRRQDVWDFISTIKLFCEVNPGYYLQDGGFANTTSRDEGFGLDMVPGIGFRIGFSFFSIACPIFDITNDPKATFGAWWSFAVIPKY